MGVLCSEVSTALLGHVLSQGRVPRRLGGWEGAQPWAGLQGGQSGGQGLTHPLAAGLGSVGRCCINGVLGGATPGLQLQGWA